MKKTSILFTLLLISSFSRADVGDLLITEISATGADGVNFIEIHNSGVDTVDLTDVYLTDATFFNGDVFYYKMVNGVTVDSGGGGFFDFNSRFPNGATIGAGEYQTVAIDGSAKFFTEYGINPTYELYEDGSADAIPDMLEATSGSINGQGGLSGVTRGEVAILYTWDGISDLVQDLDYVIWVDTAEAVDKSGVSIDGPDVDSDSSAYLSDTATSSQIVISTSGHSLTTTWQRTDLTEGTESQSGGNGFNGSDETSENLNVTFTEAAPTPNAATGGQPPAAAPNILINELDAVGAVEFIELYGDSNASLDDVKVVFYDGDTDQVYNVVDLSGESTDSSGYFLIGDTSLTPEVVLASDSIEDGADAVAIYFTTDTINIGDAVSSTNIIDAIVYGSDSADDAGLLTLLNSGQLQVNENTNSNALTESNSRCANGSGGVLNTANYQQTSPTPGMINNACSSDYYASVTPVVEADPALLRSTLHNIIDDHTEFSYSGGFPDACDILEFADADPDNSSQVWMVYSNESFNDIDACSGSYNREHTWPRSRFTGENESTPGRDTHQLMATNVSYNSNRGNLYFDNCTSQFCSNSGLTTVENNGVGGSGQDNFRDGNVFEVWDYRKGDIARAMFYMDVRYEGDSGEPDLVLTDDISVLNALAENFMGKLTTLCEWHFNDPVDSNDTTRNEAVFSYQQNRNPFVDHPEWVAKVFPECAAVDPNSGSNTAPVADAQSIETNQDMALSITLTGSDADMDVLTYTVVTGPTNGTLSGTAPNLTYIPNEDYFGSDSFTFIVNDGTVDSAEATVSITVVEASSNTAPIADAQSVDTNQDTALSITLTGSDADMDSLTYTVVTGPTNGVLSGTAPNLTYTPNTGYIGVDSFTFKVNDGTEDSDESTVSITVKDLIFSNGFE